MKESWTNYRKTRWKKQIKEIPARNWTKVYESPYFPFGSESYPGVESFALVYCADVPKGITLSGIEAQLLYESYIEKGGKLTQDETLEVLNIFRKGGFVLDE